ncbi:MAG: Electron transfer flavoprotein, beta subunit [Firmicutes bacterium]|nr:Electron transfer flavoprotein, beta subunit [Bacillota bacterium]MDI6705843.1 electron transfer flavoprotein subunit beta/FixA family protein [Bacillota bacterium]
MEIIVCIKQVPDTTEVKIDPEKGTLIREGVPSIVNPFDEYAVEAALRIKEEKGGKVTVITMGPPQAVDALRKCVAMGADDAVLVSDRAFAGSDTWSTSYTLAKAIQALGAFDLILCGKQAIDGDTAQVGPGIAEHLKISQVTYVQKVLGVKEDAIEVERGIEGGYEVIETPLPAVLTIDKSANQPRLPSMMGTMKALKKEIKTLTARDINVKEGFYGMDGSPTRVKRTFTPPPRKGGRMLGGEMEEALRELVKILREEKIV